MLFRRPANRGNLHVQWLGGFTSQFLAHMLLVLTQKFGVKFDISGLVNTMDVSESSGDTEVWADGIQGRVDLPDVLRLSVELGVIDSGIIDAVLLATGNANLHLEPEANGGHPFEVLLADSDVLLLALLGKVKHVRGEERFLVLLEIGLISLKHPIKPLQELVSAMIGVQDNGTGRWD